MTGTGTQNDPYIVDTWPDFVAAIGTSGAYVKVADDTVWDMNSIAPEGIGRIYCTCAELDGNNAVIQNLYFNAAGEYGIFYLYSSWMHDISFINFTSKVDNIRYPHVVFTTANGSVTQRVTFSGIVTGEVNHELFEDGRSTDSFRNCSVNLKFILGNHTVAMRFDTKSALGRFENNHIIIDVSNAKIYTSSSSYGIYNDNSIVEIVRAEGYSDILPRSNARSTIVRYDKGTEREKNYVFDAAGAWHEVTSAQLQDAAYLASIGFPIGVD